MASVLAIRESKGRRVPAILGCASIAYLAFAIVGVPIVPVVTILLLGVFLRADALAFLRGFTPKSIVIGTALGSAIGIVVVILWAIPWRAFSMTFFTLVPHPIDETAAGVVAFAVLAGVFNAFFEELLWRVGVVRFLASSKLSYLSAAAIAAVAFGASHFYSMPNGWVGVAITTALGFGASLLIRRFKSGIAIAIAAHATADAILITFLTV